MMADSYIRIPLGFSFRLKGFSSARTDHYVGLGSALSYGSVVNEPRASSDIVFITAIVSQILERVDGDDNCSQSISSSR